MVHRPFQHRWHLETFLDSLTSTSTLAGAGATLAVLSKWVEEKISRDGRQASTVDLSSLDIGPDSDMPA